MLIPLAQAASIFGFRGWILRRPSLGRPGWYCLVLAWLFIFPTVLLGFMDWQHFYQSAWFLPIIVKISLTGFLFVLLSIGDIWELPRDEFKDLLANDVIAFLTVGGLGYFGGRLELFRQQGPGRAASFSGREKAV